MLSPFCALFLLYICKFLLTVHLKVQLLTSQSGCMPNFQCGCASLYAYQQHVRAKISFGYPSSLHLILSSNFHKPENVKCCLIVVLICIFLIITNVEHFLVCLVAFYVSSSVKFLFTYLAYFSVFFLLMYKGFI